MEAVTENSAERPSPPPREAVNRTGDTQALLSSLPLRGRLIGQSELINRIDLAIANDRLPHALLISGPDGVGKRLLARIVAETLIATDPAFADRESAVHAAALFSSRNYPDVHLVEREEGKKDIAIETIRETCHKVHLQPYMGTRRIILIEDCHRLSLAAANCLLMTLEEPSSATYFLLTTHAPHLLPPTILSRCHTLFAQALAHDDIVRVLESLLGEQNVRVEELAALAELCQGTLSTLELSSVIGQGTLRPSDGKEFAAHLTELASRALQMRAMLSPLAEHGVFTAANVPGVAHLLAGEKSTKRDTPPIEWFSLLSALRKNLGSRPEKASAFAIAIEQLVACERLARERTTNAEMGITNALLGLAQSLAT